MPESLLNQDRIQERLRTVSANRGPLVKSPVNTMTTGFRLWPNELPDIRERNLAFPRWIRPKPADRRGTDPVTAQNPRPDRGPEIRIRGLAPVGVGRRLITDLGQRPRRYEHQM